MAAFVLVFLGLIVLWIPMWGYTANVIGATVFAVVGGLFVLTGSIWQERLDVAEGDVDEREEKIRYRAGWCSLWVVLISLLVIAAIDETMHIEFSRVILAVVVLGVVTYAGLMWWLERTT